MITLSPLKFQVRLKSLRSPRELWFSFGPLSRPRTFPGVQGRSARPCGFLESHGILRLPRSSHEALDCVIRGAQGFFGGYKVSCYLSHSVGPFSEYFSLLLGGRFSLRSALQVPRWTRDCHLESQSTGKLHLQKV